MSVATTEFPAVAEQVAQTWMACFEGYNKIQEINEKMLVSLIEYNHNAREQGRKVAEKMLAQVAENQKSFVGYMDKATRIWAKAFEVPQA